jgi:hypothetical protein
MLPRLLERSVHMTASQGETPDIEAVATLLTHLY